MSDASQSTSLSPVAQIPSSNRDILTAAKGGGILFFGDLLSYASRFAFGVIIARAIGANGYGLYDLGSTPALLLSAVALLGLPGGVLRFLPIAISRRDEARVWGILQTTAALTGGVSLVLALAIFGLADLLAGSLFHKPALAPMFRLSSACIPLAAFGSILKTAIQGFKEMHYQVYAESIAFNIVRIGLTVLLLNAGLGAPGALVAYIVAWVVEDGLLLYYLNRLFPLWRPLYAAQRNMRELLSFSVPLWLTQIVGIVGSQTELLLLGMLGTIASVGVFSAALHIQRVGAVLIAAVQTVAKPIISDLHHQDEYGGLRRLYCTLCKWTLSFNLPFFLTTVLFARPILAIFGEDFTGGVLVLILVAVGTLVDAGTGMGLVMISMTGNSKLSFYNSLGALILKLSLDVLLIREWGVIGAAMATGLAIVIMNVVRLLQVYWLLKILPYDATFVKPVIATVVALVVGLVMNYMAPANLSLLYLILDVALLWSSYVGMTILLGISEEDRLVIARTKGRLDAMFSKWQRLSKRSV